jgi:hypothetical protein
MSAKNDFETALLTLIFDNTAIANIGDAGGLQPSSADGNLYIALYTVTPSDSADGTECDYTGYARVAVLRDGSTGWTISGNAASNTAAVTFGQCTAGATDVAVAFAICTGDTEGASDQILWGPLTANLTIEVGVTPEFPIGALSITCD